MPNHTEPNDDPESSKTEPIPPLLKAYIDGQLQNLHNIEQDSRKKRWKHAWRSASPITKGTFILTTSVAVATIAYVVIAALQLCEMRHTNQLTQSALQRADQSSLDSSKQFQVQLQRFDASLGQEQILASQAATQALQTTRLATDTHDLADSGKAQSEATQKIAINSASQLMTMNQTLEIDHRAWIRVVDIVPEYSLTLDVGSAQLNFAVNYLNMGNLPASNVLLKADMIAQKPNEGLLQLEMKETEFCEDAAKVLPISSDYTELLYPSLGSEQHYIARTQIDSSYVETFRGSNMKLLNLFIVGCINYRFMTSNKDHQVGFI